MKKTITFLFGLYISLTLFAQSPESYLISKLIPGCPVEIEPIKNQIGLTDFTYTFLETGIDSVKILFGSMKDKGNKSYWISLYNNDKIKYFQPVNLEKSEDSEILAKKVDIVIDWKRISVKIMHKPLSEEIHYNWLNNDSVSKKASIIIIDRPIQKHKQFPNLELKSINGDKISTHDYEGKYLVVNWWNTSCAPCRKEIPGLNKLVEKYKLNPDIVFVSIALENKDKLENYLESNEFNYLQTLGDETTAKMFGIIFPINIIVNPQGVITYYCEGGSENKYLDIDEELKKQMDKE